MSLSALLLDLFHVEDGPTEHFGLPLLTFRSHISVIV